MSIVLTDFTYLITDEPLYCTVVNCRKNKGIMWTAIEISGQRLVTCNDRVWPVLECRRSPGRRLT